MCIIVEFVALKAEGINGQMEFDVPQWYYPLKHTYKVKAVSSKMNLFHIPSTLIFLALGESSPFCVVLS